ncbi:MAG: oligosaccharide flippase family protein [Oscillospiraceae bacterium]|jgi:O-antigen/teichoic acid export membrane protein|nr:oligosaccharide flippase family protein [Oscillospiraceae bacterium]
MSKYKTLAFNTILIGAGGFVSGGVGFFLLRFYTKYLSAESIGVFDLINNLVILLVPIVTLSVVDAVVRFCLEKKAERSSYFSVGVFVTGAGFLLMLLLYPLFSQVDFIKGNTAAFYLLFLTSALRTLFTQPLRAMDKVKLYTINEFVTAFSIVICGVLFIYVLDMGLTGYLYSFVVSYALSVLFVLIAGRLYRYVRVKDCRKNTFNEMLRYSAPLTPNAVSWWATNLLNRYILLALCGGAIQGLFSVAGRLPMLVTIVANLVMQAWQISAISEYASEDRQLFFSRIYQILVSLVVCACSFVLTNLMFIAGFLFKDASFSAWKYAPFLLLGAVFNCFAAFLGTIYLSEKRTKMNLITTIIGAAISIILCWILIPIFTKIDQSYGGLAAGISNIAGFGAIFIFRAFHSKKYVHLKINYPVFALSIAVLFLHCFVLLGGFKNSFFINLLLSTALLIINGYILAMMWLKRKPRA